MLSYPDVCAALAADLVDSRPGASDSFTAVQNDSRLAKVGELFFALATDRRDGHTFVADAVTRGAAGVVVQHEVETPAGVAVFRVRDTTHAIGELARWWRKRFSARAIAITGNVGKTTTKELSAGLLGSRFSVLKSPSNFNDEIGLSMTLFQLTPAHERIVVEVAMERLGEIRRLCEVARPETAVVMSVGPTHLSRLGSLDAIASAKAEAVEALPAEGTAILNADDHYVAAMAGKTRARVLTFGFGEADLRATEITSHGLAGVDFTLCFDGRDYACHTPVPGRDLVRNALAAVAVAITNELEIEEAIAVLRDLDVEMRLKPRHLANGVLLLDDCYNASPASMIAALEVLEETPGRHVALLGDMLELGSEDEAGHRRVGERAARVVDRLFTTGTSARTLAEAALAAGLTAVDHFATREEALAAVQAELRPGDVLLVKASHGVGLETVVAALAAA